MSPIESQHEGIAIIGMAGRFPGARNIAEFWQNLTAGAETISQLTDGQLSAAGLNAAKLRADSSYVAARGLMERPEWFDSAFFGITPKEAEVMDPQQRVFLEESWTALEDAGCDPARYPGAIGVFAGMSNNTYFANNVAGHPELIDAVGALTAMMGNEKDYLATRVAYKLNLKGPALSIYTACSTSLVAVCQACTALLNFQCDAALAGGVSITFPQERGYTFQDGGITSLDGHCRAFDADAAGTVFSSGVGIVVLKRLAEALADGDQIYAVIKGSALNNDGSQKVSFTAPSVDGHAEVIALAQALAGFAPETISYIEAHGTGTPLGDPIEIAGLTQAFRAGTDAKNFCAIGSVKTNIGHLDVAAGVAGLIKTALALRHGVLPPSLHFHAPNPKLDLENSPFHVNTATHAWDCGDAPRRAGVSSFGVGGTNAHVVLEEAPAAPRASSHQTSQLIVLSARTAPALEESTRALGEALGSTLVPSVGEGVPPSRTSETAQTAASACLQTDAAGSSFRRDAETSTRDACAPRNFSDIALTLQAGRHAFNHRRAVIAHSVGDAIAALGDPKRMMTRVQQRRDVPVAFMFPGQGAQFAGMGAGLFKTEPVFRDIVARCAEILRPHLGGDLREAMRDPAQLAQTRITQPALFVIEYALAQLWMTRGISPTAMIGHSVGEYVAACLAGVFSLEDALALVARRAALVQAQPPGAMLAVRLPEAELAPLLDAQLSIAAINAPNLCVASGPFDAVENLEVILRERGVAARRLETSHAFHSGMMDDVIAPFTEIVRGVRLHAPKIPFVSNVTADWITDAQATDPAYWAAHVRAPVRFAASVARLLDSSPRALLECGPGQTLATLARQHPCRAEHHEPIATLPEKADENDAINTALGRLWLAGVSLDWQAVHAGENPRRVSLPTYPFERQRYWAEPRGALPLISGSGETVDALPLSHADESPSRRDAETSTRDACAPQSRSERLLAEVIKELQKCSGLDLRDASPDASFTELGFDSLFLTQASLALQKRFRVPITFRRLLEDVPTPRELAAWLDEKLPDDDAPVEMELRDERNEAAGAVGEAGSFPYSTSPSATAKAHGPFRRIDTSSAPEFTPTQRAHLDDLIARYTKRTAESKRVTAAHRPYLADPRAVAGFRRAWKEMVYPLVTERSLGAKLWDADGHEYVDVTLGFGQNLLGHRPPFVIEAVSERLHSGIEIGPTSPLAGQVAALTREFTGLDRVAFCNTGSEAVTAAIRTARTVTGRSKIALFAGAYHGIFDEVLVRPGADHTALPIAPGIEPGAIENVLVLEYGTDEALAVLRAHAHELAAVLVEPVQSRRPELQPRDFLHEVRRITAEAGSALVFDEVVTGFRIHPGGAQAWFGVKADIATYGKVVGGGLPIGIVAGAARFMDALDGGAWNYGDDSFPEAGVTFFAGTFVRHPLALAAAKAVLEHLREAGPALQEKLNERTAELVAQLNAHLATRGVPLRWTRFASMYFLAIPPEMKHAGLLWYHLRLRGIHAWESRPSFLSTAHTDADVEKIVTAFRESVDELLDAGFLPGGAAVTESFSSAEFPLTDAQQELLLATRMGPEASASFNESITIHLRGALDMAALDVALNRLVARHEALRTTFADDGKMQRVAPALAVELPLVDLSALAPEAQTRALAGRIETETTTPFDLARGPLLRAALVRLAEDRHDLVLTVQHIVCDGWSFANVVSDLAALSSGRPLAAPGAFREYARWLREKQTSPEFAATEDFWLKQFSTLPPAIELPSDHPRGSQRSYHGARCATMVPRELHEALKRFSAAQRCTLFTTMLAAFQVLLHRLTGQDDLVVGIAAAGQAAMGREDIAGHCLNFLPIRARMTGDPDFIGFLGAMRTLIFEAFDHQNLTFGALLQKLALPRDASRMPLLGATFNIDRSSTGLDFAGLGAEFDINPKLRLGLELSFNLLETEHGTQLYCAFNRDLFEPTTIDRWLAHYLTLLGGIVADAARPLSRLPLLSEAEQRALTDGSLATRSFAPERCIHELFEAHASATPDAVALVFEKQRVSYGELNTQANRLAHHLRALGVGAETLVAICLERSPDLLVAILGVLKAGGAYVPLDPDSPGERLGLILADAQTPVVLTQEKLLAKIGGTTAAVFCFDRDGAALAERSTENPAREAGPEAAAYVIYTSGSTGVPKGVVVTHHNVVRLFQATDDWFHFTASDVWTLFHSPAFDFSVWEIWGALACGGRLVIVPYLLSRSPAQFYALLAEEKVTVLNQTPLAFQQFIRVEDDATARRELALRFVIFGGEALDFPALRPWFTRHGEAQPQLVNMYGITETTVHVTYRPVTLADLDAPSGSRIGCAIPDLDLFVLDRALAPCPIGLAGELYVGGAGVARGYLRREGLTVERFIPHPWRAGARLYKSGDLARRTADGDLEYLGRADLQVKVRGYRIELGEIEAALLRHPGVAQCAVVVRALLSGESGLAAYYVRAASAAPAERELRAFVQERLPSYMVPSAFVLLDALPLNLNGKLDAAALPAPSAHAETSANGVTAPSTALEKDVSLLWAELLGRNSFSIHDDFFAVGGHSLLAIQLLARVREKFRVDVPVRRLFDTPTIEGVAQFIAEHLPPPPPAKPVHSLISIQRGAAGQRPFFLVPGGWGGEIEFLVYGQLKLHLGTDLPIYGLNARGSEGIEKPHRSVREMAVDYVDEIRTVQPHGPYLLGGECIGGVLAYEMARRLEEIGEKADLLVLLDTELPHRAALRQFCAEERSARRRAFWQTHVAQPFRDHMHNLSRLTLGKKIAYIWQRASRKRSLSAPPGAEPTPLDARKTLGHYPRLLMAHPVGAYRGKITLLIDETSHAKYGKFGWDSMENGGIELHVLPGDHLSYIRENAALTAAKLRALIDTANQIPA